MKKGLLGNSATTCAQMEALKKQMDLMDQMLSDDDDNDDSQDQLCKQRDQPQRNSQAAGKNAFLTMK